MPEGHTIHRLARDHRRWLRGEEVRADSPQGRADDVAAEVDGRRLLSADAWGKHLFHGFEGDAVVHTHLGLFGKFRHFRSPPPDPRGAVRLRLIGPEHTVSVSGPTACELYTPEQEEALIARLGPDPLRRDADPERARAALARRRTSIAAALMDQKVIAGVGNVYRAEALHVCRIDPLMPARELTDEGFDALWETTAAMLALGVRERRIVTRRDVPGLRPSRTPRSEATYVYKRELCGTCEGPVRSLEVANRTLWWCPACQTGR